MSIGAQIGDGLQKFGTNLVTKLMGMGDYHLQTDVDGIKKNALFKDGKMPMSFAGTKAGILMTHSEYLGLITSSETAGKFHSETYPLQPLNSKSFPWLSQFADAFERYEVEGVVYRFESLSGVAVSGQDSSLGTVAAYFHYDPNDAPAASKAEMLQYSSSVSAKTSENLLIGAECDPTMQVVKQMYVDDSKVTSDKRFSSKGFFTIATDGLKAEKQTVGELWVHYKIRFHIPKIHPSRFAPSPASFLGHASYRRIGNVTEPFSLTNDPGNGHNKVTMSPQSNRLLAFIGLDPADTEKVYTVFLQSSGNFAAGGNDDPKVAGSLVQRSREIDNTVFPSTAIITFSVGSAQGDDLLAVTLEQTENPAISVTLYEGDYTLFDGFAAFAK
jgi:hypothetical protein